ncbi:hypothetical protein B0H13DRAFT_1869941 [Mycena leptocephala]|nr:hypothetical protein B0H13DRAFT_1869941 [Mycena leptocephala]
MIELLGRMLDEPASTEELGCTANDLRRWWIKDFGTSSGPPSNSLSEGNVPLLESTVVELAVDNGECPPLRILFAEALGNKTGHICGCERYTWGGKKTLPRISTSVRALRATNAFQFRIRLSEGSIQLQSQVELASCVETAYLEVCGKFAMVGACLQNFGWVRLTEAEYDAWT